MARTLSTMLDLGTQAPDFSLPDTDGSTVSLADFQGKKGLLVMFICNHCPYVIHVQHELVAIAKECQSRGMGVVAISSNDIEKYPDDAPGPMKERARELDFTFPYLFDESQEVAKDYMAACTPDLYLFDSDQKLVYRGQLDESRPSNGLPVTGGDLRTAIDAMLDGKPISSEQKPSMGCNIKWLPGNEPVYFG